MKTKLSLLIVAILALAFTVPTQAQSTNAPPGLSLTIGTNVVVQPAITASTVTIESVDFNFAAKRADIFVLVNGGTKHWVIQGAAFTAMVTNFQAQYGTPFASYLAAHPPQ